MSSKAQLTDVAIIGAGIGGLSAAIYSKLGGAKNVTVIEQNSGIGGKAQSISQDEFRFDPGPSIVILTDIYEQLFIAAGRQMSDYLKFHRLDPFTRVYHPSFKNPLDFPSDENECIKMLGETVPEDAQSIRKLMADLEQVADGLDRSIYDHPFNKPTDLMNLDLMKFALKAPTFQPYKKEVDKRFKSPLLKAFFYGFPSYSGQSYLEGSPGSFMIPYYMLRKGVYWPEGGIAAIPNALYKLAKELGVQFQFNTKVTGINLDTSNQKITSLQVLVNNNPAQIVDFPCTAVISNRDRLTTEKWLRKEKNLEPSMSYFTLQFGYSAPADQLLHHTLFIPESFEKGFHELYVENQFPQEPIVYVNETSHYDPTAAPQNHQNIFAVVTSPSITNGIDWEKSVPEYRTRIFKTLSQNGLDIDQEKIKCERIQTPLYFAKAHGNYKGSLYGATAKDKLWGFMPLRCKDELITNLYYAGGSVQPGAGMPMVTLSGKFAAQLLTQ